MRKISCCRRAVSHVAKKYVVDTPHLAVTSRLLKSLNLPKNDRLLPRSLLTRHVNAYTQCANTARCKSVNHSRLTLPLLPGLNKVCRFLTPVRLGVIRTVPTSLCKHKWDHARSTVGAHEWKDTCRQFLHKMLAFFQIQLIVEHDG
jgi:hypothetical protein